VAIAKACQISTPCERPQSLVLQGLRYNRRAPVTHTFPRRASISTRPRRPATCARHKVRFGNRTRDGPNAAARTREARTRDTHNLPNTIHNPPHGRAGIFRIMGVQRFLALLQPARLPRRRSAPPAHDPRQTPRHPAPASLDPARQYRWQL